MILVSETLTWEAPTMSMSPYEPFRQIDNMRREMDRYFSSEFPFTRQNGGQHSKSFGQFHVDVYETEGEVIAICDIPGLVGREDVNIDIHNQTLTVSGTLKRGQEYAAENMHHQERFAGRFNRAIQLPTTVSNDGTKATYRNGVLEVRMSKSQGETKKRIDVQFH